MKSILKIIALSSLLVITSCAHHKCSSCGKCTSCEKDGKQCEMHKDETKSAEVKK